jgi:hypothetical protein
VTGSACRSGDAGHTDRTPQGLEWRPAPHQLVGSLPFVVGGVDVSGAAGHAGAATPRHRTVSQPQFATSGSSRVWCVSDRLLRRRHAIGCVLRSAPMPVSVLLPSTGAG